MAHERVRQRVVDDAGVTDEDHDGAGPGVLEALDLDRDPEEAPDPCEVAAAPADAQVVDQPPPPHRPAAQRTARRDVDRGQRRQRPHLGEEEPPREGHQADPRPGLAPHDPQHEVGDGRAGDEQREQQREGDEAHDLDPESLRAAREAFAERAVVREERACTDPLYAHPSQPYADSDRRARRRGSRARRR